jgi:hydrogenase small subunit
MAYPSIQPEHGVVGKSAVAVGVGGAVIGALAGAGFVASKKMTAESEKDRPKE